MKWIGITGSWRKANKNVEDDVRKTVSKIIASGNGIVTGGALGVDYFATEEVLILDPQLTRIKIYLPTTLDIYVAHYRKRVKERIIIDRQAEDLISQLQKVKSINSHSIIENSENEIVNIPTYFERNTRIVEASDELYAFQVNKSKGTQDTVDKAKKKGIPIYLRTYTIV